LHLAAKGGHLKMVSVLLDGGDRIEESDKVKRSIHIINFVSLSIDLIHFHPNSVLGGHCT
jgi:hypothetical protein